MCIPYFEVSGGVLYRILSMSVLFKTAKTANHSALNLLKLLIPT